MRQHPTRTTVGQARSKASTARARATRPGGTAVFGLVPGTIRRLRHQRPSKPTRPLQSSQRHAKGGAAERLYVLARLWESFEAFTRRRTDAAARGDLDEAGACCRGAGPVGAPPAAVRAYGRARPCALSRGLQTASPEEAAWLSLVSFARHTLTEYDELLADGYDQDAARHAVSAELGAVLAGWGVKRTL